MTRQRSVPRADTGAVLRLEYQLADLPTSQHRAGLAGFVLVVRWLERRERHPSCVCRLSRLSEAGATVELNQEGLRNLFDTVYAATKQERAEDKIRNSKDIAPIRTDEIVEVNAKGQEVRRKRHFYEEIVPKGEPLVELDPTAAETTGAWMKLWRDFLWSVPRSRSMQRKAFTDRANGTATKDASDCWERLLRDDSKPVKLASTLFLGCEDKSPERVAFTDQAKRTLLLHFWPFAVQVYVPQAYDPHKLRSADDGFLAVFPDVSALESFCDEMPHAMRARGAALARGRPRDALVVVPSEGAIEFAARLRNRLSRHVARDATADLVLGFDAFHFRKDGNNVRLLETARIDPTPTLIDEFRQVTRTFHDSTFRRQRLMNMLAGNDWFYRFDRVCSVLPAAATIGSNRFCEDARRAFRLATDQAEGDSCMPTDVEGPHEPVDAGLESLVYRVVHSYVSRKVRAKLGRDWEACKRVPKLELAYGEERERQARHAFLACRSRSGRDFVEFFTATICAVPHYLTPPSFQRLARALQRETVSVRTLTLLALSAASWRPSRDSSNATVG